jgi:Rieske Fe-S protein
MSIDPDPAPDPLAVPLHGPSEAHEHCSRRRFCQGCIAVMSVTSAAMVGYPVLAFLRRPERLEGNKPTVVPLDQLVAGQAQYVDLHGQQLIVLPIAEKIHVFSASCPHLGCSVIWDSGEGIFRCPCHGAMFNSSGQIIRGPVAASMESIPYEINDGKLIIS